MKRKLTKEQAQAIVNEFFDNDDSSLVEIASKYDVTPSNIGCIVAGRSWKKLNRPHNMVDILRHRGYYSKVARENFPVITTHQLNLIFGSLLGDGSLTASSGKKNSLFRKLQKHKEHLSWLAGELYPYGRTKVYEGKTYTKPVIENGKIVHIKTDIPVIWYTMRTIAHPIFTSLRNEWYKDGVKSIPLDIVLNPEILAIWYVDDGGTDFKRRICTIATNCFTLSEVELLQNKLRFDLKLICSIAGGKPDGRGWQLTFCGEDYDRLLELVRPFVIWDCFAYKVRQRISKRHMLTRAEKAEILRLQQNGLSPEEISEQVKVQRYSIVRWLKRSENDE